MSYVYGLFANEDDVKQALDGLERSGKSDEVVEVITQAINDAQSDGFDTPLVPVAGVIPAATTSAQGMSSRPRRLEGLGEMSDYFSSSLERGGQIIVVDTSDAEVVGDIFRQANAQRIYDKRTDQEV